MNFLKEYQHDIIVIILTLVIGSVGTTILTFLLKKGKTIWDRIVEKRKSKKQRKEYEEQVEAELDWEWTKINKKINEVILNIENFKKNYSSKLPNSKERISYIEEYIKLIESNLTTDEQENKLLDIKEDVVRLYEDLMNSNQVSKKEKKIYLDYIEKIKVW